MIPPQNGTLKHLSGSLRSTFSPFGGEIVWLSTGFLLTIILGILDGLTGAEISFSLFYLAPVSLVTWRSGRWPGLMIAMASAGAWFWADSLSGREVSSWFISLWNAVSRLGIFVIVTILLTSLRESLQRECDLARTDFLTGVANSRHFFDVVEAEIQRARRENSPFTILYLDLDDFKSINDRYGHAAGDRILRTVAKALRKNLRAVDLIARIGGDEFACLLPGTNENAARGVVNRLVPAFEAEAAKNAGWVRFSLGVLICFEAPPSAAEALKRADALMYTAKRCGRNQALYAGYHKEEVNFLLPPACKP